jgi:hypothetical protein
MLCLDGKSGPGGKQSKLVLYGYGYVESCDGSHTDYDHLKEAKIRKNNIHDNELESCSIEGYRIRIKQKKHLPGVYKLDSMTDTMIMAE